MVRCSFKKIIILLIILLSSAVYSKDNPGDEFAAGKVEFIDKSGKEGIVLLISPEKSYLLNKGVLLLIKRGDKSIVLKITDVQGAHLRCRINSETEKSVLIHGENVFYSDAINSSLKYRDAKLILSELIKLYEGFILKIESTEEPVIIADAVKNFSAELDRLIPEMKRINSRYPELEKFKISPPAELQGESAMLEVLEPRLRDAFFKIQMFNSNENVKKSTEDLQKIIQKMNTGR